MKVWPKRITWPLVCEGILTLVILWSVWYSLAFLRSEGRLPQPFYFDNSDTFMDWFNVAYWAHNPGAFDPMGLGSVYPPLSFIFLRLTTVASCYRYDAHFARDCDWMFPWVFAGMFVLNTLLVWRCYWRNDRSTAVFRTLALNLGLPMLFGVERGQLLMPCFTAFVLAHGNIVRSARWKWFFAGIAINFKPYLLLTVIPSFLRRRWTAMEGYAIATVGIYVVTFGLLGAGSISELIRNTLGFNEVPTGLQFALAYFNTTYDGILLALKSIYPFTHSIGSTPVEGMAVGLPVLMGVGSAGVVLCFLLAAWKPYAIPLRRLTALSVAIALTNSMVGGYALILLFFLVFFEPWRGPARITALVATYVLSICGDITLVDVVHGNPQLSYLGNREVTWTLGVSVGQLARPAVILLIEYALVAQSLMDVWKARKLSTPPTPHAVPQLA